MPRITTSDARRIGFADRRPDGSDHAWTAVSFSGVPGTRHVHATAVDIVGTTGGRLVTIDRPRWGQTDAAVERDIECVVRDVEVVLDHLEIERFAAIGHSAGCVYALACAALLPERVDVAALSAPVVPTELLPAGLERDAEYAELCRLARTDPERGVEAFRAAMATGDHPPGELDPRDAVIEIMRLSVELLEQVVVEELALVDVPWGLDLGSISAPVLARIGAADHSYPVRSHGWLVDQVPSLTVEVDDGGHAMTVDRWTRLCEWTAAANDLRSGDRTPVSR